MARSVAHVQAIMRLMYRNPSTLKRHVLPLNATQLYNDEDIIEAYNEINAKFPSRDILWDVDFNGIFISLSSEAELHYLAKYIAAYHGLGQSNAEVFLF